MLTSVLPREAREGLERAWLEILRERHPGVEWQIVPRRDRASESNARPQGSRSRWGIPSDDAPTIDDSQVLDYGLAVITYAGALDEAVHNRLGSSQ